MADPRWRTIEICDAISTFCDVVIDVLYRCIITKVNTLNALHLIQV